MTIDIEIRHVTKVGANLFLELGFPLTEAKKLQAASRKQINDTRALKQQLMPELSKLDRRASAQQADAAQILMVSRPRVSDVVNQKTAEVHHRRAGRDARSCWQGRCVLRWQMMGRAIRRSHRKETGKNW